MPVKPFAKLFLGTAIALAAATTGALAGPVTLSFGITGLGSYLVNTTNITLSTATKIATTSSSLNPPGSISEEFQGSVTQDTSVGHIFLGQSATISETCTQPPTGSSITCSDSR